MLMRLVGIEYVRICPVIYGDLVELGIVVVGGLSKRPEAHSYINTSTIRVGRVGRVGSDLMS